MYSHWFADLHDVRNERRQSVRSDYNALVCVNVRSGPAKGAAYLGLLRDIGDGGIGVLLDGAYLERGTSVAIEMRDLPHISAQVCHCTPMSDGTLIGFEFVAASHEAACWHAALSGTVTE